MPVPVYINTGSNILSTFGLLTSGYCTGLLGLKEFSNRIINEIVGIARVTYDASGKPPFSIEWE